MYMYNLLIYFFGGMIKYIWMICSAKLEFDAILVFFCFWLMTIMYKWDTNAYFIYDKSI